jgi:hypothetical protein
MEVNIFAQLDNNNKVLRVIEIPVSQGDPLAYISSEFGSTDNWRHTPVSVSVGSTFNPVSNTYF